MVRFEGWMARQFGHPAGAFGGLIGLLMDWENRQLNHLVYSQLALTGHERILEIGFGTGRTLARIAGKIPQGFVAGIDPSESMVTSARRRCRRWIRAGRAEVRQGEVSVLPYGDGCFDAVLSVNTVYFWPDPERALSEIHRVLKPGGRLLLGYHPAAGLKNKGLEQYGFRLYSEGALDALLRERGFASIRHTHGTGTPYGAICTRAYRGPAQAD
ncbi:class I SAM-dependent methyltransferase [Deinococcus planocerae]|uniref:class I SAM-dependent methyltransferase n=1 Tax=Deinococcus planocerae TaxID=1737569 RepID=UPI001FE4F4CB|nr:class I SAM-dependent methyltransferase [Deinococcus planocerae]